MSDAGDAPHPNTGELVLALDQGGHASRAIAFDAAGQEIASALVSVGELRAGPDVVEQDPEELVASLEHCIASVARELGARAASLSAAALATQRSSIVAWERTSGRALTPVISWQDRRAWRELEALTPHANEIARRTGLRLSPHYGASKLAWCLEHVDAVRRARDAGTLVLGPLSSFLAFRLSRERPLAVDPANASRTLLWNVETRDWDEQLCAWFGVERAWLPRCERSRAAFGTLRELDVPLRVVLGDQSAALFAWGEPRDDALYANLGTGAFLQRPLRTSPPAVEGLLRSVVFDDGRASWSALEGTINGAGSALAAEAAKLGVDDPEGALERAWASERAPGVGNARDPGQERSSELPLFLNGVSGLAAPWWRADFVSRYVGGAAPGGARDASAKLVAVAESVAFLAFAVSRAMEARVERPARLVVSGGWSRSAGMCRTLAEALELAVARPEQGEATARGAAWLAFDGRARFERGSEDVFAPRGDARLRARRDRWMAEMLAALGA